MKARYISVLIFLFFLSLLIFTNYVYTSTDVTSYVQINKSGILFDRRSGQTSYDVTLTNISGETIQKPVYVAIKNLSPGEVTVANPDGYTAGGDPYYDYSALIAGAAFDPGGISSAKKWIFNNPNRLRFTYTAVVFGPYSANNPPVADAGMDQNALTGVPVYLDGSGSYDPDGDLITFQWTMTGSPEGSSAVLSGIDTASPGLTPDVSGDYTIQLTVNDGTDNSVPDEVIIHASVSNVAPNADAGPDQSALVNSTVFLDGSGSFDPDNAPDPLTYTWTFISVPLNSIFGGADLSGVNPVFIPDKEGVFILDIEVSDGDLSDHDRVSIFVEPFNVAPNANAGPDQIVWQVNKPVNLDGSASFDSDNGPSALTYQWSFVSLPAGSSLTNAGIVNTATSAAAFTPDVYGAYVLNLAVNDGALSDNDHVMVIVTTESNPPQIDITNPIDGAFINTTKPNITVTFSDDDSGIDTGSFYAEINGADSTSLFTVTDTGASYQATNDLPVGDNVISVSIADNAGNISSTTSNFRIGILRAIPGASPTSGPAPLTVRFTTDGEDPAGTIEVFRWDFDGNGTWDTYDTVARDYNRTYNTPGRYNATLYVRSSTGESATASILITVENNPPVATADVLPSNGEVPLTVQLFGSGTDSDGQVVLYEWDFEGDGVYDWSSTTTGNTSYTYTTPGTYQAVFRVTDNNGLTSTALPPYTIVRAGPPGSPTATVSATPTSGNAPLNVNLSCTATDPDNDVVLYEWDFDGDGTYDWSSSTTGSTSHIYDDAGTHVSSCRVTDSTALTGIDNVLISVNIQVGLSIQKDTVGFLSGSQEPAGTNINTSISADTQVSIIIKDSDGNIVRTLVNNQQRSKGSYSDYWDVKDDYDVVLTDGIYYAVLQYIVDGQVKTYDLTNSTGGNRFVPPRQSTGGTFSSPALAKPFEDQFLPIRFSLNKASEVTVFVGVLRYTNTRIRTIYNRLPMPAGQHTAYWDGLDDNENIANAPPGNYLILGIWGYTLPENAIFVTGGQPVISNVAADPNYFSPFSEKCDAAGNSEGILLSYDLSEDVDSVELRVYSLATGNQIRTASNANVSAGSNIFFWDGKNNNGEYADIGDYQVGLIATDAQGNQSMFMYTLVRLDY